MTKGANLVALSFDHGVVGHASLVPMDEKTCELLVVVSPTHQALGIGTRLMRSSAQVARELGFARIWTLVEATNHVARHIYEESGFEYLTHDLQGELEMTLDVRHANGSRTRWDPGTRRAGEGAGAVVS